MRCLVAGRPADGPARVGAGRSHRPGVRGHPGAERGDHAAGAAGVPACAVRHRGRGGGRRIGGRDRLRRPSGRSHRGLRPGSPAWLDGQGLGLPARCRRHERRPAALPRRRHGARTRCPGGAAGPARGPRRPGVRPALPPGRAALRAALVLLQPHVPAGQRRLHAPPVDAPHGLRPVPAQLAYGLRGRRRPRCRARRGPRRRAAGSGVRPGGPAGAVCRGRRGDPDAELSRRAAPARRRVDEELRLGRIRRRPRARDRIRAVAERPPCRGGRCRSCPRRGDDRSRRVRDVWRAAAVGGRLGGVLRSALVDPAADRLVQLVDLGALPPLPRRLRRDLRPVGLPHAAAAHGPVARPRRVLRASAEEVV